jgi:hypothetical protein
MDAVPPRGTPTPQVGRGRAWLAVGIAGVILVGIAAGVWQSRSGAGSVGSAAKAAAKPGRVFSSSVGDSGPFGRGSPLGQMTAGRLFVAGRSGARFDIGLILRNLAGQPLTITGVHADSGVIRLANYSAVGYSQAPAGTQGPPSDIFPYPRTRPFHPYLVAPGNSAGLGLFFVIGSCTGYPVGSHLIYDRTITVDFTQAGRHYTTQVPSVPLDLTVTNHC